MDYLAIENEIDTIYYKPIDIWAFPPDVLKVFLFRIATGFKELNGDKSRFERILKMYKADGLPDTHPLIKYNQMMIDNYDELLEYCKVKGYKHNI